MGRGIIESGLFRSERYQFEQRTTDPASAGEGEMWIRTDLAPDTDQLATLRFDNGSRIWDIPIYDSAASTTNVRKAWRVQVGGVTGFVPITTDSPAYPALKYQHNGAAFGAHDALKAIAIPDSAIHQYDATAISANDGDTISAWVDTIGTADLSGTATYRGSKINGNPGVEFNGSTDDFSNLNPSASQATTIMAVASQTDTSNNGFIVSSDQTSHSMLWRASNSEWQIAAESNLFGGGSNDGSSHYLITGIFDGANSVVRVNGTQVATGNPGTDGLNGLYLGSEGGSQSFLQGDIGEVLICNNRLSSAQITEQEQRLSDKFGLGI